MALSSSPASVSYLAYDTAHEEVIPTDHSACPSPDSKSKIAGSIALAEFVDTLPRILHRQKEQQIGASSLRRGTDDDPVNLLFRRLDLSLGEWRKYALFDPMKNYTRNLIATDNETFTLLLLCWNPSKESPIHDHPWVSTILHMIDWYCMLFNRIDLWFVNLLQILLSPTPISPDATDAGFACVPARSKRQGTRSMQPPTGWKLRQIWYLMVRELNHNVSYLIETYRM